MHHLSGVTNFRWEWMKKNERRYVVVEHATNTSATQVSQMQANNKLKLDEEEHRDFIWFAEAWNIKCNGLTFFFRRTQGTKNTIK